MTSLEKLCDSFGKESRAILDAQYTSHIEKIGRILEFWWPHERMHGV